MLDILREIFKPETATWLGVLAPFCAAVSISISVALSPWFSWTHNAISDLGVSEVGLIFNLGLIVTGILILIFAAFITRIENGSRFYLIGAIGLIVMGVSIVGAGVCTEEYRLMHAIFTLITFASLTLSSILFGVHFVSKPETRILGILALPSGILSIMVWFAVNTTGLAIKEALSSIPAFGWYMALAIRTRMNIKKSK